MSKYTTALMKSSGICLAFVSSILTFPTFSETLGNSPQCDNATLHTTTGPATLNARWTANTIILNWQPGDDATFTAPAQNDAAYSCEYDGGITLPTAPTRSGYTFGGWRVGAAAAQCVLSDHLPEGNGIEYGWKNDTAHSSPDIDDIERYNLTEDNTWAVEFSEGVLKGRAICSGKQGNNHNYQWGGVSSDWTATENQLLSVSGERQYCWCAGIDFGNSCHIASPSWAFDDVTVDFSDCAYNCAFLCASKVRSSAAFRQVIFGSPTQ